MASRIALLRHGQTEWSATGRHTSVTDVDLTDAGVTQAEAIPGLLQGLDIRPVTVWSSPRIRARRTADIAGLSTDAIRPDLAEWDYGTYEGLTTAQIQQATPGWSLFTDGCPGGELPDQVGQRADRLLADAAGALTRGDLVLVCHGHLSRVLAVRWIGLPVTAAALIAMDAAAVTVLGRYHGAPIIDHANVVPFALRATDD